MRDILEIVISYTEKNNQIEGLNLSQMFALLVRKAEESREESKTRNVKDVLRAAK